MLGDKFEILLASDKLTFSSNHGKYKYPQHWTIFISKFVPSSCAHCILVSSMISKCCQKLLKLCLRIV